MRSSTPAPFDFDDWARLARRDPEAFECRRRAAISAAMDRLPPERRLRLERIQWRVDRERERSPTAMAACLKLYGMMWSSLAGQDGLLARLNDLGTAVGRTDLPRATVLRFPTGEH